MENPKLLISCGCSYTQVPNTAQNWPVHLTNYLNCDTLYLGQGAAGNGIISKRAIYYINESLKKYQPEEILVGIMWSSHTRQEFLFQETPSSYTEITNCIFNYINPCSIDIDKTNRQYYIVQPPWKDELSTIYYKRFYDGVGSAIQTLENILRVQWFCEKLKIKYFFTNINEWTFRYDYSDVSKTLPWHEDIQSLRNLINWNEWLPIDNAWDWFINESGYPEIKELGTHPSTEQNKALVDRIMIPHLKSKGYIN